MVAEIIGEEEELYLPFEQDTFQAVQRTIGRNQARDEARQRAVAKGFNMSPRLKSWADAKAELLKDPEVKAKYEPSDDVSERRG
jgi:hypothetical protein